MPGLLEEAPAACQDGPAMPELPDVTVYVEALERRILGEPLAGIRIGSPFVLRTVAPSPSEFRGRIARQVARLGKRIVIGFEDELHLVIHLMIAGRLHWRAAGSPLARRVGLAAFDFPKGSLVLTEVASKKRAAIHAVRGDAALATHDPGGLEVLAVGVEGFRAALMRENHTLKRTLTDPRLFSGIGNAYADEILHRARLSPIRMAQSLNADESARLYAAARDTLAEWIARLRRQTGDGFPEKVTAFRPKMAVHGRFGKPCPVCGAPVQRIVHAENETNYCPGCQTGGRLLADRALSRLLKSDWPRTLEELEERRGNRTAP
jgi:formamidopyrimidine-DNA glycosylase